jgi:heme-degrading monooxygenase HmoA
MFARITTFRLKPGALDDLIRAFQDSLALAAAEQPGFGGITLLTDVQSNRALTIGLWASEADLLASERSSADQEQLAKVNDLLVGLPIREVYEVSVQVAMTPEGTAHLRGL